jgi:glycyl-tRNA synthetase beta chain
VRASVGEVFKRAANIAKDATDGAPEAPVAVSADVHPSEAALFSAFEALRRSLEASKDPAASLSDVAKFAPVLGKFFEDVFVMVEDERLRNNRLRLMREIHRTCSHFANFNLLARA